MSRRSQLSFKILLIVGVLFISFLPHVTLVNVIDLDYCPREGTQYYKNLEWKHCRSLQRLHCQKDASSNVVSFCHTPVLCGKGKKLVAFKLLVLIILFFCKPLLLMMCSWHEIGASCGSMTQWVVGSILHGGPIELYLVPASAP